VRRGSLLLRYVVPMAMSSAAEVVAIAAWTPSCCLSLFTGQNLAQRLCWGREGRPLHSPLPEGEEAGGGARLASAVAAVAREQGM
jgi:hypothetical protein